MTDLMHILLTITLAGSLLALALALVGRLTRDRLPKAAIYYLWLLVLLRLCLPWAVFGGGVDLPQPAPPLENALADVAPEDVFTVTGDPITVPADSPYQDAILSMPPAPWYERAWQWVCDSFLYLWLAGSAAHFLWFLIGYLTYSRILDGTAVPLGAEEQALLAGLSKGKPPRAFRSPLAKTPMVLGLVRPRIVLPDVPLTQRQLGHILHHELTHLWGGDLWIKWFAVTVTSFHWFNPLMPWLRREISRWCELCCDERVVRAMSEGEKEDYGRTLLALAAAHALPRAVPVTTLVEEKARLRERLSAILTFKQATAAVLALCLALTVLFTGCAGLLGVSERLKDPEPAKPDWQGPDWVAVSENYITVLTGEELDRAVELIDQWQKQNLPDLPDRKLVLDRYDVVMQKDGTILGLSYLEHSWDQLCLDVRSGEIGPCTGPIEKTDACGYAMLYGVGAQGMTDIYLFYLTRGGDMATPEESVTRGLEQLETYGVQAYADCPVVEYSWWIEDGTPVHNKLEVNQYGERHMAAYDGGTGIYTHWFADEAPDGAANLPARYLPQLTRAVMAWQRERDPVNGDTYRLEYGMAKENKFFLSRPENYADFLGVVQYSLSAGTMTVLEAPTEQDAPYGHMTLLYPARGDTWLYLIGE